MVCSCCQTGRCCNGSTCNSYSQSECAYRSGSFTLGGDCTQYACTAPAYDSPCSLADACACAASGKTPRSPYTTCNCNTLTAGGVPYGGCQAYYCNTCDTATGLCVYSCPSPRACCAGTCCPLSQRCSNGSCVAKCASGTTFCAGSGANYTCCTSSQKCCGTSSGCLPIITASFTVDVTQDAWVDTGVTLTSGASVTISASSRTPSGAAGPAQWTGSGSTASPDGVTSAACNCCDYASVTAAFCHMALIGRVDSGSPFLVGSSYTGTPGAGRLYLRQNDGTVYDNGGSFVGTITTDPCPGFTPASVGEPVVYASGDQPTPPPAGPGAELKTLLRYAGIVASPTCSCNARATQMDAWGEWECLQRLPEICGWLKEEAGKRGLLFFPPAGLALILAAISLSALKRPFRGNNQ